MASEPQSPPAQPLLPPRLAGGMALIAAAHALLLGWALAAPGTLPMAGMTPVRVVPYLMCALASAIAALAAPLLLGEDNAVPGAVRLGRAAFAALWQGAVAGFFLMIAARLTPLSPAGIARAAGWLAVVAFTCLLLAGLARRAYAGLSFFWLFAMPVCGYLWAEIFLITPVGNSGWTQSTGPQASAMRAFVHGVLSISPATGATGALTGVLFDGSEYALGWPLASLALVSVILSWRTLRAGKENREVNSALGSVGNVDGIPRAN